jgi:hypothetical protein
MINENIKEVSVKPIQFPHKRPLNSFPEPSSLTFRKPKSLKDLLAKAEKTTCKARIGNTKGIGIGAQ